MAQYNFEMEERFLISPDINGNVHVSIRGTPHPSQAIRAVRPRFQLRQTRQGNHVQFFQPHTAAMNRFIATITQHLPHQDHPIFHNNEALQFVGTFKMRRPASHFRPGMERIAANIRPERMGERIYCTAVPDLDNMLKFVLDALKNLIYTDDRQVVRIDAIKIYDNEGDCTGSTEMDISPIPIDLIIDLTQDEDDEEEKAE